MKLIGYLQSSSSMDDGNASWPDQRISKWAVNYGDILVSEAIVRLLDSKNIIYSNFGNFFELEPDIVVIRGSTYLHDSFDFDGAIETLRSIDCPIACIGLGAQNQDRDIKYLDNNKKARDFISILSEKSFSISVRGFFTADVLNRLGAKNLRVTGCPSLGYFKNFRSISPPPMGSTNLRVGFSTHTELFNDSFCKNADLALKLHGLVYSRMKENGIDLQIYEQGNLSEIIISDRLADYEERKMHAENLLQKIGLDPKNSPEFISKYVRLSNLNMWLSKILDCDALLGFRFHGLVAGLMQGVPAYLYTYDSRLEEFRDFYKLPGSDIALGVGDPIASICSHDWGLTNDAISSAMNELNLFMSENNLANG